MDWIFDNLQIVLAIAGAIAYWLNARSKDKAGEEADYDGDGQPDNVPGGGRAMREHEQEMEQAEHTRRIQEEIRRKIAERQGGGAAPQAPMPPPMPPPLSPPLSPPPMPPAAPVFRREEPERGWLDREVEERRAAAERESEAVLERQRGLAAQLAALQSRKDETTRAASSVWAASPVMSPSVASLGQGASSRVRDDVGLLSELRNTRSLRRAIILREVLGTPVGLK